MTKKTLNKPTQNLESLETQKEIIEQETKSQVKNNLQSEKQDESKEKLQLPNVIICRKYYDDKCNDMDALKSQLPEILGNVTYISDPSKVVDYLKSDAENIIFIGQYFNHSLTGTEVANQLKKTGLNVEVSLITSIVVPDHKRINCDYTYQISTYLNKSDGADIIVRHLKSRIKKS